METLHNKENLCKIADILAETARMLISNGANSARTKRNLQRIAETFGYKIEHFFSHSAIVLTVEDVAGKNTKTIVKTIAHHGVNYSIVSEISILSWEIARHKISFEQIDQELEDIKQMDSYPDWLKMIFIGIATAALAKIFDGTYIEFGIAFMAGVLGFFARKLVLEKKYNHFIGWFVGAFISATVVNACRKIGMEDYHGALTACVLWLIPGVPLINGSLDIVGGHIVSGIAKLVMGFMMVFMIAVGFYLSLFIFGYGA